MNNSNNPNTSQPGANPRPGAGRAVNIQPSQIPQLAQAFKNEIQLAKQAGDDTAKAQQHYAKANSIKQILMNYQAQQKALKASQAANQGIQSNQAQQNTTQNANQQTNVASQPISQQMNQNYQAQKPQTQQTQQPQQQTHQQSMPQQHQQQTQPLQQQQHQIQQQSQPSQLIQPTPQPQQSIPQSIPARTPSHGMSSPAMNSGINNHGPGQSQQSPMMSNVSTPSLPQGTASSPTTATNSTVTVERFNQVKARLAEFQKKIQKLEYTKNSYQFTPEQLTSVEAQQAELKSKYQQYETYAVYMKQQLLAQARAQTQSTGLTGNQGANIPNTQYQRTQQIPVNTGINTGTPRGTGPQQPPPPQQPRPQQQTQGMTHTQPMNQGSQPQRNMSTGPQGQQVSQGMKPMGSIPSTGGMAGGITGGMQNTSNIPVTGSNIPLSGSLPVSGSNMTGNLSKQGRSVSPPGMNSVATPNKPSPGGTMLGPPLINLSGITKPSVPPIPISSTINVKPPTAVTLKPNANTSRATLMGGGANGMGPILGTPAMVKLPTYELSVGAGESIPDNAGRVLTKRKLNELVNTIGADEGDGKTNIDGDVEELLLDLADEFITSVTGFACRLAKHRKMESVDVRDVQLHLERNWNIRIPGYAMDEIKSTRKWQPSSSYTQKVSGVDISKSVNGNIS